MNKCLLNECTDRNLDVLSVVYYCTTDSPQIDRLKATVNVPCLAQFLLYRNVGGVKLSGSDSRSLVMWCGC